MHNVGNEKPPTLQKNLIHCFSAEVKKCKYFQDVKEIYRFASVISRNMYAECGSQ
jgi:hypothetical protein